MTVVQHLEDLLVGPASRILDVVEEPSVKILTVLRANERRTDTNQTTRW